MSFSPLIVHDGGLVQGAERLDQIDGGIGARARAQLEAEVLLLTPSPGCPR